MQFFLHNSGRLPAIALALLMLSLWTVMALSAPAGQETKTKSDPCKATCSLALPTIMAPVIRKEVRQEQPEKVAYEGGTQLRLPSLIRMIMSLP